MKKIYYILFFTLIFASGSFAQSKSSLADALGDGYLKVFPIPAVTSINFEFQRGFDKSFSIQIFNFIGKQVYDVKTSTPKMNIPVTDFSRGVYIYQLRDPSGKIIESGKFQVIK